MRSPFYVSALPRSGTTFLANFFTDAGVFCHHEALVGCKDLDDYVARMTLRDYYQVGDSDSGLIHCYKQVRERFPSSIWVGIRRDPEEVMDSLMRVGFWPGEEAFGEMLDMQDACLQGCSLVVDFKDLFLTETLRNLWQTVTGLRFDARRAEMLARIKVEPEVNRYRGRYAAWALGG